MVVKFIIKNRFPMDEDEEEVEEVEEETEKESSKNFIVSFFLVGSFYSFNPLTISHHLMKIPSANYRSSSFFFRNNIIYC